MLTRGRRTAYAVLTAVVATIGFTAPVPASATFALNGGTCVLSLNVSFSPPLSAIPTPETLTFGGGGTCAIVIAVTPATMVGIAGGIGGLGTLSCAGGVTAGTAFFETTSPSIGSLMQVVFVHAGAVIYMFGFFSATFAGSGVFLQDPVGTATCPVSGLASTTWTGSFTFEDPILAARALSGR